MTASAQGVREHTRSRNSTPVSESQANELTLTLTEVSVRPIQIWVRTAGLADATGRIISAELPGAQGGLVKAGQRVRAFPPDSRSSMTQARVESVAPHDGRTVVKASLTGQARTGVRSYVLEIVTEPLEALSIPNEAIIERNGRHLVYVKQEQDRYRPVDVTLGLQGELFTEVVDGLKVGEQVVTFGSFFIDAEHKLKGS